MKIQAEFWAQVTGWAQERSIGRRTDQCPDKEGLRLFVDQVVLDGDRQLSEATVELIARHIGLTTEVGCRYCRYCLTELLPEKT